MNIDAPKAVYISLKSKIFFLNSSELFDYSLRNKLGIQQLIKLIQKLIC